MRYRQGNRWAIETLFRWLIDSGLGGGETTLRATDAPLRLKHTDHRTASGHRPARYDRCEKSALAGRMRRLSALVEQAGFARRGGESLCEAGVALGVGVHCIRAQAGVGEHFAPAAALQR